MKHIIIDLPPQYPGGKGGRRCCVCDLSESICIKHPQCRGKNLMALGTANAKTVDRARKRHRRLKRR